MRKLAVVAASAVQEPLALAASALAGSATGGEGEARTLGVMHVPRKNAQAG
jgi:hypothetical protein